MGVVCYMYNMVGYGMVCYGFVRYKVVKVVAYNNTIHLDLIGFFLQNTKCVNAPLGRTPRVRRTHFEMQWCISFILLTSNNGTAAFISRVIGILLVTIHSMNNLTYLLWKMSSMVFFYELFKNFLVLLNSKFPHPPKSSVNGFRTVCVCLQVCPVLVTCRDPGRRGGKCSQQLDKLCGNLHNLETSGLKLKLLMQLLFGNILEV